MPMSRLWSQLALACLWITLPTCLAQAAPLTIEELRIEAAQASMPEVTSALLDQYANSISVWRQAKEFTSLKHLVQRSGDQLWQAAKRQVAAGRTDDRALYWTRLSLTQYLRQQPLAISLTDQERLLLIGTLEASSRGRLDLDYTQTAAKKILITGFDPFLLDSNLRQSNPSGFLALSLDGAIIEHSGIRAEINSVTIPVRYADFDAGLVESVLAPYYAANSVDLIVTISMGRTDFDLEHFPGRRRSASAPDNLNQLAGGSDSNPVIPRLGNALITGPEFVEFSLPYTILLQAAGKFAINDRRQVTTLEKTFEAESLKQLAESIAVRGSGGGYLSNEISYRSIRLKDLLGSTIPTGHIHTPRMPTFDRNMLEAIKDQVRTMLNLTLTKI